MTDTRITERRELELTADDWRYIDEQADPDLDETPADIITIALDIYRDPPLPPTPARPSLGELTAAIRPALATLGSTRPTDRVLDRSARAIARALLEAGIVG